MFKVLNTVMDFLIKGPYFLEEGFWHFFLAAFMGLLGFSLMWTISSAFYKRKELGPLGTAPLDVVFITIGYCLLVGFGLALVSHSLLDGLFIWYTTPKNPPLELKIPPHLWTPTP